MIKQQQVLPRTVFCNRNQLKFPILLSYLDGWMASFGQLWHCPPSRRWLPTEICFGPTTFTLVQVLPKTSTHAAQVPRTNEYAFPPSGQQKPASLVVDPHNFDCTLARILIYKQDTCLAILCNERPPMSHSNGRQYEGGRERKNATHLLPWEWKKCGERVR